MPLIQHTRLPFANNRPAYNMTRKLKGERGQLHETDEVARSRDEVHSARELHDLAGKDGPACRSPRQS